MIIPIRCFTCGKPVAHLWETFDKRTKGGENPGKVMDDLGLDRYCCRRMLLTHIELIDDLLRYNYKI